MTDRVAEREAITAAMHRLLTGCPQRSTGALTVLQLAAETADLRQHVDAYARVIYELSAQLHQQRAAPPLGQRPPVPTATTLTFCDQAGVL
jgi:hypothetical protein